MLDLRAVLEAYEREWLDATPPAGHPLIHGIFQRLPDRLALTPAAEAGPEPGPARPRTVAGRALMSGIVFDGGTLFGSTEAEFAAAIAAIEAEAVAAHQRLTATPAAEAGPPGLREAAAALLAHTYGNHRMHPTPVDGCDACALRAALEPRS